MHKEYFIFHLQAAPEPLDHRVSMAQPVGLEELDPQVPKVNRDLSEVMVLLV